MGYRLRLRAEKKIYPVLGGPKRTVGGPTGYFWRLPPRHPADHASCLEGRALALQLSKNLRQRLLLLTAYRSQLTLFRLFVPTRFVRVVLLTITAPKLSPMTLQISTKKFDFLIRVL